MRKPRPCSICVTDHSLSFVASGEVDCSDAMASMAAVSSRQLLAAVGEAEIAASPNVDSVAISEAVRSTVQSDWLEAAERFHT